MNKSMKKLILYVTYIYTGEIISFLISVLLYMY